LSTGTGIVPGQDFSLSHGDVVSITIGGMTLANEVAKGGKASRASAIDSILRDTIEEFVKKG
jgi:hypothetical protein